MSGNILIYYHLSGSKLQVPTLIMYINLYSWFTKQTSHECNVCRLNILRNYIYMLKNILLLFNTIFQIIYCSKNEECHPI